MSAVSGLDFLDDGRCVAPVDWDLDGDLDLWFVNRTGPTLRFVRNDGTDQNRFVYFRLEGTSCNRDAVGARVEVTCGEETLIRTLRAGDGYLSQASKWMSFGLGPDRTIDRVVVKWPAGESEVFSGAAINQRFLLVQGAGTAQAWTPPQRTVALTPSRLETVTSEYATRVVLRDRIPMPDLNYQDFDGKAVTIPGQNDGPVLVNLWATWCAPCLTELKEFSDNEAQLRALGVDVVALTVEAVSKEQTSAISEARELINGKLAFPFRSGVANPNLLEKLDAMQKVFISLRGAAGQLPSSFLLDRFGRLSVIYPGRVTIDQLIEDVRSLEAGSDTAADAYLPLPGTWLYLPKESSQVLIALSQEFKKRGLMEDALRFGSLAADVISRHKVLGNESAGLASMFFEAGLTQLQDQHPKEALRWLLEAVRMKPDWAEAHTNLGNVYSTLGREDFATEHLIRAVQLKPKLVQAHFNLGLLFLKDDKLKNASEHFQATVQIQPNFAEGHHRLGVAMVRMGYRQQGVLELRQAVLIDADNAAARTSLHRAMQGLLP